MVCTAWTQPNCHCCFVNSQENRTATFYLYDAVYLYLRTVNQTLSEGYSDYKNGRLVRNKTIGQRFTGRFLTTTDSSANQIMIYHFFKTENY